VLRYHTLTRRQRLARPVGEVFDFFADAGNLEAITPPSLRFRVVSPLPIAMEAGALIEYRLRIRGVPLMWLTRIESWEPGRRFVDAQLAGPYALWHHTHEFEALGDGSTLMCDVVRYALPFGPVGELAHAAFVSRELAAIFDFRHAEVARRFGSA
jgi:hypothetical protein